MNPGACRGSSNPRRDISTDSPLEETILEPSVPQPAGARESWFPSQEEPREVAVTLRRRLEQALSLNKRHLAVTPGHEGLTTVREVTLAER
jgi:hypothetical protein